jgi:hypothetical protein
VPDENDGKIYEMANPFTPTSTNNPPAVNAEPETQTVTLPGPASLDGTVTDDGLPAGSTLTRTWSNQTPGTGAVTFANANAEDTTATFSAAGTYTLRLTGSDGSLSNFDDITVTVNSSGGGGGTVLDIPVAANADDAEEPSTGAVDLGSSDLELGQDGSPQTVGLRFAGVSVPRGATITSAYVQFQADETNSNAVSLTVDGQASDTAAAFTTAAGNVSSRPRTAARVAWNPPNWPTLNARGADQRTPSLVSVVQEIVSRPGWASGNALGVMVNYVSGTGRRTAEARESGAAIAPVLHVEFSTGTPPPNTAPTVNAGPDQTITLPAGATLDGTVTDDGQPSGTLTTTWSQTSGPAGGTTTFGNASNVDTTASFSTAGTYVLRLTASDGALPATDDITVTVNPAGGATVVVDTKVAAAADDAEQNNATGAVDLASSDLELIAEGSVRQTVGLRFAGVAVPAGKTITNAYVQFNADEAWSGETAMTVRGELSPNAATFTTATNNISSRPSTSTVNWTPAGWPVDARGEAQRTPNLASVVQQIVNQGGWASGNAMAIIVTGTDPDRRTADAFEGGGTGGAKVPTLHIEYTG